MAVKAPQGWYDISVPLKQGMNYLPLDPVPPKIYRFNDVELGAKVTMSMLEIISHTGTHIDTPLHFIPGGSTVSDMPLDATIGPCRVIEIKDEKDITVKELEPYKIKTGERILFKTKNSSHVYNVPTFEGVWVALTPESAEYLVTKKIRMVGLDYLTVAHREPPGDIKKVHQAFLSNGIFILEAINLDGVPAGKYEMMCLTIRIENGDAAPCRVILKK